MSDTPPGLGVYQAINAIMAEIASTGIAKDAKNQQQGYNFRGIDAVYNALCAIVAKHQLVILPKYSDRVVEERASKSGGVLFYTTVHGSFKLISAVDGSVDYAETYGEAMDSADKSTNKSMSAAHKYAFIQIFQIPTVGDNDADLSTHEVAPRQQQQRPPAARNGNGAAPVDDAKAKYERNYTTVDKMLNRLDEPRQADAVAYFRETYKVDNLDQLVIKDLVAFGNWMKATYFPNPAPAAS